MIPLKRINLSLFAVSFLAVLPALGQQPAGNPQSIFVNTATRQQLEKNTPSLRDHLEQRRVALEAFSQISASELQPVTLTANVVAKGRSGVRELRVRQFQYIGDCPASHGGNDVGMNTPTVAQAVFASDLADSWLNQAALLRIPIDSLAIELHGRPDKEPTGRVAYPRNFLYTVYVDSPASDDELERLGQLAEECSPIAQFVKEAQEVTSEIEITPSPREKVVGGSVLPGFREYLESKRQAIEAGKAEWEKKLKEDPKLLEKLENDPHGPVARVFPNGIRELTIQDKYRVLNDNPAYLGGTDLGLTSRENVLAVLGTCITHIAEGQAASLGVVLDSLSLTVTAQWDPRAGRKGFEQVAAYPTGLHYVFRVKTPETRQRILELQEAVEKICPMYNLFRQTQTFERRIVRTRKN